MHGFPTSSISAVYFSSMATISSLCELSRCLEKRAKPISYVSHEKNPAIPWNPGGLIRILIMACYNPNIAGWYFIPQKHPKIPVLLCFALSWGTYIQNETKPATCTATAGSKTTQLLMVQKSGDHHLRFVVYPIVYRVWKTSQVVVWDFFHQQ